MADGRDQRKRSSAELQAQIAATRARLSVDLDVAREKLSPRGLQREAMGAIGNVRRGAEGAVSGMSHSAEGQASHLGRLVVDAIKRHPVASTAVGLGLALLAMGNGRRGEERGANFEASEETPFVRAASHSDLPPPRS